MNLKCQMYFIIYRVYDTLDTSERLLFENPVAMSM